MPHVIVAKAGTEWASLSSGGALRDSEGRGADSDHQIDMLDVVLTALLFMHLGVSSAAPAAAINQRMFFCHEKFYLIKIRVL